LSWAQKAFGLAERFGDPEILAACYNDFGVLSAKSGEFEKARDYGEQGLKIALENKVTVYAITFYNQFSMLYGTTGEFQKMFETAQKGSEFSKKVGSLYGLIWLDSVLAGCYVNMGEMQKAISIFEDVLTLAKRTRHTVQVSGSMSSLGWCHRLLGEWDKSLHYLMEALDIAKKIGEYQFSGSAALELGELFMEMEDYAEAEKYLQESNSIYEKAEDIDAQLTGTFPALARLYLKEGETEKAEELIEKTYEHAARTKNNLSIHYAEMLKAMLFREQRNWEQSIQHFERSLQGYKSLDAQEWYVHQYADLLHEYGLMHLNRNEEGDKEKALSLLNQALEIYKKVDAKKKMEKVTSEMTYVESPTQEVKPEPSAEKPTVVAPPDYISTGCEDLDNLLMGGIPKNYAVIMTSPSCDERDLLIKRFLEKGVGKGETTFYVTIDPSEVKSAAENFPNFYLFVCNPQADAIIKSLPNVSKLRGVENLTDINIALNSAFRDLDKMPSAPRRACIGIISDILLQHQAVQTRRWLTGIIAELKSRAFTTLAVMNTQMHSQEEVQAVLDLFEGELNIYEKTTEKGSEKFLRIKKMYNRKYSKSELRLQQEKLQ